MSPFEYVYNKVFTRLEPSKIQGIGLFAVRDIPKGEFIFEKWNGPSGKYNLTQKELDRLPKLLKAHILSSFLYNNNYPYDSDIVIELYNNCHWIYTTPYYFVNSSHNFNIDKDTLLTTRNIKEGEEILSNYKRLEKISDKDMI